MVKFQRIDVLVCLLGIAVLGWTIAGCGEDSSADGITTVSTGGSDVLGAKETKRLLRELPYRYKFRTVVKPEGAEAAVAGRAVGRHQTVLNFGIALGSGHHAVPVPRAGTSGSYGYPKGHFIFTDDVLVRAPDGRLVSNPNLSTAAQWREANSMSVMMTDKLCLAVTGEHCPP